MLRVSRDLNYIIFYVPDSSVSFQLQYQNIILAVYIYGSYVTDNGIFWQTETLGIYNH